MQFTQQVGDTTCEFLATCDGNIFIDSHSFCNIIINDHYRLNNNNNNNNNWGSSSRYVFLSLLMH
jgi:hypothetical protein